MKVNVQFFAQLGQAAGASSQSVALEGPCTAQELVRRLAQEHGPRFRDLVLDDEGRLRPSVLLFVGEEQVQWDAPAELRDRDSLLLATPIAGG